MEESVYEQFLRHEETHWWFMGRRAIFRTLLARRVRPALGGGRLRALDLGCGMGGNIPLLQEYGDAIGTDIEHTPARYCARNGIRAAVADGCKLPFADAAFDLVTALDTLEHIRDDAAAVAEATRVLRPGGFLLASAPAYQFLYTHQDRVVHHERRYTLARMKRLVTGAGLQLDHASHINFILFPGILPVVLLVKLKQAIFPLPPDDKRSNMSIPFPGPLNALLARVFSFERHLVSRVSVPAGHSLVLLARKKDA